MPIEIAECKCKHNIEECKHVGDPTPLFCEGGHETCVKEGCLPTPKGKHKNREENASVVEPGGGGIREKGNPQTEGYSAKKILGNQLPP